MKLNRKNTWVRAIALAVLVVSSVLGVHLEKASRFELEALTPKPGVLVLDCQDRILRLGADGQGRRVILLPPGPLPEMIVAAFLAAEDSHFRQHHGIDLRAIGRAAWSNLKAGRIVSGASTITQQLARLAYPAPRTYYHKFVEMLRSLRFEAALGKDEILRDYLNLVPQGNNLMGVETSARIYFGKPAAQVTLAEAALLAALAKAPGTLNPLGHEHRRLLSRRNWVLTRLARLGFVSREQVMAARQTGLRLRSANIFPFEAPHFVNLVLAAGAPPAHGVIRTTLDLNLQRRAQAIVRSHRSRLHTCGISQAAAVIIKNHTMEVAALVGSCHYGPKDQGFNDGATARRSPGSTLKPFLYAQALDLGFNPARVMADVDERYRTPRGEFIPANFDRVAQGPISMREALGNSLNLSAVSLLNQIGPPAFYDLLTRLQLINHPERPAGYYGLGLVVGNPEVSLLQLASAYACLANGGVFRPARCIRTGEVGRSETVATPHPDPLSSREEGIKKEVGSVSSSGERGKEEPASENNAGPVNSLIQVKEAPEQIFSPQAAYIVSDILADSLARARTFGSSLAMHQTFPMAIKTGTSTHYRDCWTVGYTPEYTIAVWTGNFDGRPTAKMSGASASAPILADLAAALINPERSPGFTEPPRITRLEICSFSGMLPGPGCQHRRQELFIAGTEPDSVCTYHRFQEPWHRMPTNFAGWLHDRFERQGTGRYRLAGFDPDLRRTFGSLEPQTNQQHKLTIHDPVPETSLCPRGKSARVGGAAGQPYGQKLSFGQNPTLRLHRTLFPALAKHREPRVTIASPLPGDRFLLPPGQDTVVLSVRADCRAPFPRVTWFIDGREYAATGPPYELSLPLERGHHRLTVIGPDGLGDTLEVAVE